MSRRIESSRQRFAQYRERLRKKENLQPELVSSLRRRPRVRSTPLLIKSFFRLLGDQRPAVYFSLATLTVSTILGLGPPAATKFVVDNVLGKKPLPASIPTWLHVPHSPFALLMFIVVVVTVMNLVKVVMHVGGRGQRAARRRRLGGRADFRHGLQPVAGRRAVVGQPGHSRLGRLAIAGRRAGARAIGVSHPSHVDQPHPPAAP